MGIEREMQELREGEKKGGGGIAKWRFGDRGYKG